MPPINSAHIDFALTDFAIATLAEPSDFVVGGVAPIVPVDHLTNKYYVLPRGAFARGDARARLPNSESAGFDFVLSNDSYSCQPYGLHTDIDRRLVENADDPRIIEEAAIRVVLDNLRLTHEVEWGSSFFTTGKWGTDIVGGTGTPFWDDYQNSDPKAAIKVAIRTIKVNGGRMPNTLAIGYDVWLALQDHPLIKDQVKYTGKVVTEDVVASYLGIERIFVMQSTHTTSNLGQTDTFDFVHGRNALLAHVAKTPGMLIPSAMYTFSWKGTAGGGVMNEDGTAVVRTIDMPLKQSIRYEAEMNWASKITGSALGYFFSNIVSTNI